jgi:hypothetical protein
MMLRTLTFIFIIIAIAECKYTSAPRRRTSVAIGGNAVGIGGSSRYGTPGVGIAVGGNAFSQGPGLNIAIPGFAQSFGGCGPFGNGESFSMNGMAFTRRTRKWFR